jgi:hypothetical protein
MQRSGHDKVLGRGRSLTVLVQVLRARVQIGQRAVADAGRSATLLRVVGTTCPASSSILVPNIIVH